MSSRVEVDMKSALEDELEYMIKAENLPDPQREFRFCRDRKFRFDFAWPILRIAVEVQGGLWIIGRHNRPASMEKEYEKLNLATLYGWRVFLFTPRMIHSGEALDLLKQVIYKKQWGDQPDDD